MKKLSILLLLSFLYFQLPAQIYVEGQKLDDIYDGKHLSVNIAGYGFKKIRAHINYGQYIKPLTTPPRATDETGETKYFFSDIEALNYFDEQGWELVTSQLSPDYSRHYLRRKE